MKTLPTETFRLIKLGKPEDVIGMEGITFGNYLSAIACITSMHTGTSRFWAINVEPKLFVY